MTRRFLRNKEIRELNQEIEEKFNIEELLSEKEKIEIYENDKKIILKNEKPIFFRKNEELIPTLKLMLDNKLLPEVTVDMGAVSFLINGADIMTPGITKTSEFKKDDLVIAVDEENEKPLSVGKAKYDSEKIKNMEEGKVIKNLHHIEDEIWDFNL